MARRLPAASCRWTHGNEDTLPFSTNISVPQGSYIVRVAVMDSAGRVGSVDHSAEVLDAEVRLDFRAWTGIRAGAERRRGLGSLSGGRQGESERAAGARTRSGRRRAAYRGDRTSNSKSRPPPTALPSSEPRPPCHGARAMVRPSPRVWPTCASSRPGPTSSAPRSDSENEEIGELRREISVVGGTRARGGGTSTSAFAVSRAARRPRHRACGLPVAGAPPFTMEQVLAPEVLKPFLEQCRVAAGCVVSSGAADSRARANFWRLWPRGVRRGREGTCRRIRQGADAP